MILGVLTYGMVDVVTNSITRLNYIYGYLATNNRNATIKKYLDDLESLDILLTLELVNNWLKESHTYKSSNYNLLFSKINDTTNAINNNISIIDSKIKNYNESWFSYFSSLYITNEIIDLEKHVKILNNRLKFISILQ
jgi:hypothetical protein